MLTLDLPPKTVFSAGSALIIRLFVASWRPFFLMYTQSFLVTSVRGIGLAPITSASAGLGVIGFMKAALGFLAVFFFAVFFFAVFAINSPLRTLEALAHS
jgi:hypothetical protein